MLGLTSQVCPPPKGMAKFREQSTLVSILQNNTLKNTSTFITHPVCEQSLKYSFHHNNSSVRPRSKLLLTAELPQLFSEVWGGVNSSISAITRVRLLTNADFSKWQMLHMYHPSFIYCARQRFILAKRDLSIESEHSALEPALRVAYLSLSV